MLLEQKELPEFVQPVLDAIRRAKALAREGASSGDSLCIIREAVHAYWELRHGAIGAACHPRSYGVRQTNCGEPVPDWPVPRDYLARQLLNLETADLRIPLVQRYLDERAGFVLLTPAEEAALSAAGLGDELPAEWDGFDRFARYVQCKIVVGEPLTYARSEIQSALASPVQKYYVYTLRDPHGEVFYIGKGDGFRVLQHENEVFKRTFPVHTNWKKLNALARILKAGKAIGYEVDSWHWAEHEALVREDQLIIKYERSSAFRLCNSNGHRWRGVPSKALIALRSASGLTT